MDGLKLLKEDHKAVKSLLAKLDETTERALKARTEMLQSLKQKLTVHETIEEEVLYPALERYTATHEISLEGREEHHVVDEIMAELEATPVEDETWGAKLTVMKENLEHHIEEEEGDMFPKARRVMEDDDLTRLGDDLAARKEQLEKQAKNAS